MCVSMLVYMSVCLFCIVGVVMVLTEIVISFIHCLGEGCIGIYVNKADMSCCAHIQCMCFAINCAFFCFVYCKGYIK